MAPRVQTAMEATHISIPVPMKEKLMAEAIAEGVSLAEIVRRAISQYLKDNER